MEPMLRETRGACHQDQDRWQLRGKRLAKVLGIQRNKEGWGHSRQLTGGRGVGGRGAPSHQQCCEKHTLLEASMNLTPLYVMDRMIVGIFFMCSVDF